MTTTRRSFNVSFAHRCRNVSPIDPDGSMFGPWPFLDHATIFQNYQRRSR